MNENELNKFVYEKYEQQHLKDNGKAPEEFAITQLIKLAIETKNYKVYNGGGIYPDKTSVKNFDVVVWFTMGGAPEFMVCLDNSEGVHCRLYNCDTEGNLFFKLK